MEICSVDSRLFRAHALGKGMWGVIFIPVLQQTTPKFRMIAWLDPEVLDLGSQCPRSRSNISELTHHYHKEGVWCAGMAGDQARGGSTGQVPKLQRKGTFSTLI